MIRKRTAVAIAAVALGAVAAVGGSAAQSPQVPRFKRVIVVMFENHGAAQVLADPLATTFRRLGEGYATLENYDAVAHPSLPDYLALVSGYTFGLHSDCTACVFRVPNLADTLAARSLTWRTYVEDIPPNLEHVRRPAVKARIPFLYFGDVLSSPRRMRDIVPLSAWERDVRADRLPSFSLVIPDLCHDMHNCSVRTGNRWLASFMRPLLRPGELAHTVVFITFDEAERPDNRGGGGQVPALVVGPLVRPDSLSAEPLDHYSLLRTIEDAWGLPRLGRSATAQPITGIWR
jgi:phosphatidylinositol-3-phosphatase